MQYEMMTMRMKVKTGNEVVTPDTDRMPAGNSEGSDAMALR